MSYQQVLDPSSPAYGVFINPPVDASGNQMMRAPETSGTVGVNYHQPVSWGDLSFDAKLDLLWEVDVVATIRLCREVGRLMRRALGG